MIDDNLKDECQHCCQEAYLKAHTDTTDNKVIFVCAECAENNTERFKR